MMNELKEAPHANPGENLVYSISPGKY